MNFPLTDLLKPHKSEALLRLRHSSIFLVTLIIVTFLVPLPNPLTAWRVVNNAQVGKGKWMWWICAIGRSQRLILLYDLTCELRMQELAVVSLLLLNIFQSIYALKFPRKPLQTPIPRSPRSGLAATPLKRRFDGISTKARFHSPYRTYLILTCPTPDQYTALKTSVYFRLFTITCLDTLTDNALFPAVFCVQFKIWFIGHVRQCHP
jgi:hypothetical protein